MIPALPIFVYGSLRKGMTQHAKLSDAPFLGHAVTHPEFTLFDSGAWPAAVRGGATAIVGELYQVTNEKISEIDHYERHPDFFSRQKIVLASQLEAWMWIYISDLSLEWIAIQDGCWRQH